MTQLTFRPVDEASLPAFEAFFAAPGAPKWCWCMAWRRTSAEVKERGGANSKRQMLGRIRDGVPVGLLAYEGETAVGWVSVAPRDTFRLKGAPPEPGESVWSISCFFVPRDRRREGLSRQLIAGAVAHARANGATVVEAYPVDPDFAELPLHGLRAGLRRGRLRRPRQARQAPPRHAPRVAVAGLTFGRAYCPQQSASMARFSASWSKANPSE